MQFTPPIHPPGNSSFSSLSSWNFQLLTFPWMGMDIFWNHTPIITSNTWDVLRHFDYLSHRTINIFTPMGTKWHFWQFCISSDWSPRIMWMTTKHLIITFDVQLNSNMRNMEDFSRTNATFSPASVFLAHIIPYAPVRVGRGD